MGVYSEEFPVPLYSVAIMLSSSEQWAFSMEMYFSHGHSIVAVEHAFCLNYGIPPRAAVPDQKSVVSRVAAFRTTGSVARKRLGARRTVRTPERIEAVCVSILQSPRRP